MAEPMYENSSQTIIQDDLGSISSLPLRGGGGGVIWENVHGNKNDKLS